MAIALYNPKYIKKGSGDVQPNTANVKGFVWSHRKWDLGVNELKKFPTGVGNAMLKHFKFIRRVTGDNIKEIRKMMKEQRFKCKYCDFETTKKAALMNHMKSHKLSDEDKELLKNVDEAEPSGRAGEPTGKRRKYTERGIETSEEIPHGGTKEKPKSDKDGVGWYGKGAEDDNLSDMQVRAENKDGNFK